MRVSVICTVLNEGQAIRRLLNSLAKQTRPADEIVIVDGGSSDDTLLVIQEYAARLPLRVLVRPGANISQGRNRAIETATGEIVASTDAGVWLEPTWLEHLVEPFRHAEVSVVAGFFVADASTPFETAMGATVLPALDDVDPAGFLPSSRSVAFRKNAWSGAGGYPEWLDYCEDLIFDIRLRDRCAAFAWAPDAIAHFRPRPTMASFFKQYYRYARGDGKADLWRKRHAARYATYLVAVPLLLLLGRYRPLVALSGLLAGGAVYCRAPYRRLGRRLPDMTPAARLEAFLLVPAIRVVGDVAKMLGYPAGWAWRLKNWRRREIHWRATHGVEAVQPPAS